MGVVKLTGTCPSCNRGVVNAVYWKGTRKKTGPLTSAPDKVIEVYCDVNCSFLRRQMYWRFCQVNHV